ncbi:hypothetical protein BDZ97DRAFT_1169622 [Flammula alnicola]|nr:hypothetical protein BDZ97DRAFT_1169622 [Flammula alnicola]
MLRDSAAIDSSGKSSNDMGFQEPAGPSQSVSSLQRGHTDLNTSPLQPTDERETCGNGATLVRPTSASTSIPTLPPHPPPPPLSSIVPRAVLGNIGDIAAPEVIMKDHPGQSSQPPSSGPLASEGSQMPLEPVRRSSHSQFSAPNAQTYGTSSGPSSGRIQSTTTPRPYQTFGPPSQPSNGPNDSPWIVPQSPYRGLGPTTPQMYSSPAAISYVSPSPSMQPRSGSPPTSYPSGTSQPLSQNRSPYASSMSYSQSPYSSSQSAPPQSQRPLTTPSTATPYSVYGTSSQTPTSLPLRFAVPPPQPSFRSSQSAPPTSQRPSTTPSSSAPYPVYRPSTQSPATQSAMARPVSYSGSTSQPLYTSVQPAPPSSQRPLTTPGPTPVSVYGTSSQTPGQQSTTAGPFSYSGPSQSIYPPPNAPVLPYSSLPPVGKTPTRKTSDAFVANDPFRPHSHSKTDTVADNLTFDDIPMPGTASNIPSVDWIQQQPPMQMQMPIQATPYFQGATPGIPYQAQPVESGGYSVFPSSNPAYGSPGRYTPQQPVSWQYGPGLEATQPSSSPDPTSQPPAQRPSTDENVPNQPPLESVSETPEPDSDPARRWFQVLTLVRDPKIQLMSIQSLIQGRNDKTVARLHLRSLQFHDHPLRVGVGARITAELYMIPTMIHTHTILHLHLIQYTNIPILWIYRHFLIVLEVFGLV